MRGIRKRYYNLFSYFYDPIIKLHSLDKEGYLRGYMVKKANINKEDRVLDLCTGTGSVAIEFSKSLAEKGVVVGVDFSRGMLKKAKKKAKILMLKNVYFVEANVADLPFKEGYFNAVICSHAFYELKEKEREKAIKEMYRTAQKGGRLLLMEHEVPQNIFLKFLFYFRIYAMGSKNAKIFLKDELSPFKLYFNEVTKEVTPSGRSKLILGYR
ncbi:MAG: class I SAM-dependent methyltransferase [Thermodesulfobacteriota bacterium]|nr:class I SAM-dependent methyltransferase [Thermodesulfobacteriota bacterium]